MTSAGQVVNSIFKHYDKLEGGIQTVNDKGKLVACVGGVATEFALNLISQRGTLFIEPGTEVYEGMVRHTLEAFFILFFWK
jgi:GTP-binding protein